MSAFAEQSELTENASAFINSAIEELCKSKTALTMRDDAAEEIWYARLQNARCYWALGDEDAFVRQAMDLLKQRPNRAEPLYDLARFHRERGIYESAVDFAKAGLALERPGDAAKFVEELVYQAGLQEELSIAAFYSLDPARKDRGFAACNWLALNRDIPADTRDQARRHLRFYATPAAEIMPSFMARPVGFKPPVGWHATRPSVSRSGDEIILIQRVVNSAPEEGDRRSPNGALFATSRDFLLQLNSALDLEASSEILPPQDVQPFENIRLLCWRGALWCSAILRELTPEGQCQQVLARIDESGDGQHRLTDCRVFLLEGPLRDGENWMPLVEPTPAEAEGERLRFISLWDPVRLVDETAQVVAETRPPIAADEFRGGTQAIDFDGGRLALIREEVAGDTFADRATHHRFVWLDEALALRSVSRPFFLNEHGVEFVAGLAWHPNGERLIISYGVGDSESWIATVDAAEVRAALQDAERLPSGAWPQTVGNAVTVPALPALETELRTPKSEDLPAPNLGSFGAEDFVDQHSLRPARDVRSRLDAYPRVLIAILAKQKEIALPLFLRCIQELDYPKSSIVLYVRTNNNTDRTEQILRDWIARVGSSYAAVELDAAPVEEPVETFAQHEWNATRFRVLGNIRNVSLAKTGEHACDFYFVCDVDNFIRPCTLRELVALKLPIVAPLLRITDPDGYYSNFFAEIDPNGFYGHCDQYQWILQRRVRGVFEVPLVHCTYLIRGDVIPKLRYLDGSDRYEFVVFSDGARKAGIQQYIDNRQVYGYITFDAESDAATGIVGDQRDDQIAFAQREIERQHGQKLFIQESSMDTMPTISVLAPRRPSNDFANGFNELSETIFYGLRHLGYHARIVSRLSEADGQIIVVAANTLSHDEAMQLPAGTVIYNAEPFPQVWQVFPRYADEVLRKYKVWDYNPENAKRLSASLGKAVEYVPLGYVPELTRIEKTDLEDIDVLFYGTVNARRRTILDRLEATGLKVNILCGVFGTERNAWIARSKVVLNVHSHEPGVFEIVRVAFLLANAKAVVSECNPGDAGEAIDADLLPGIVAAKYDDLVEACVSLVADDDRRHAIEQAGFAAFQARRESDILKNALAATESDAAKGIVKEGRHDQIVAAAIALESGGARTTARRGIRPSPISSRLGLGAPLPEAFVINLDQRTDRWAAIESTCNAADLMPVRIPAIEASPAWRGCTLSHLKCIRIAKERNLPWILILEDDATFTPEAIDRFRGLLGYLWENREHWERFNGGPTLPTTNPAIRILSREPPLMYVPGLTTHFSLVHSDAYEMILTWDPECDPVIDMFYISLESRFRFRNIATVPHIAVQTTSRSDLTGSEMNSSGYYHFSEHKLRESLTSISAKTLIQQQSS